MITPFKINHKGTTYIVIKCDHEYFLCTNQETKKIVILSPKKVLESKFIGFHTLETLNTLKR